MYFAEYWRDSKDDETSARVFLTVINASHQSQQMDRGDRFDFEKRKRIGLSGTVSAE